MAIIRRITRVANPRRKRKTVARRAKTLKRAKAVKRRNVRPLVRHKKRTFKRSNPMLIEFGVLNPHKRRKSVARKRSKSRKVNPLRRRRAVARRTARRVVRRRRANPVMHTRRRRRRNPRVMRRMHRRNPMGFTNKQLLEAGTGVLLGVAGAKYLPTVLPPSMTSMLPQGSFTAPLITAAATWISYEAAKRFLPGEVSRGVAIGGSALVMSQVLNVVAPPSVSGPLRLAGVGDIVQTQGFAVPDRVMLPPAPPIQMPASGSGVGFYNRRRR